MLDTTTKLEPEVTLKKLARKALSEAGGNTELAVASMSSLLRSDRQTLNKIVRAAIDLAIYETVQSSTRAKRAGIVRNALASRAIQPVLTGREKVTIQANAIKSFLLDMPLAGGVKLRDATTAQILDQIRRYETQSGDMLRKARFLRLVLQAKPDDKTPGDILSEERTVELFDEASREFAA